MIQSANFNPVQDPKLLCTCQSPKCDQRSVDQDTLDKLQLVRNWIKRAMVITSGGRCPNHPDEVHRTKPADHQKGKGVDVRYKTEEERNLLMTYGAKAGFNAIAAGSSFVHLGVREQKHISTWSYK